jgi:hypothetical protein
MRAVTKAAAFYALGYVLAAGAPGALAQSAPPLPAPARDGYPAAIDGLIYKDAATGTILYVETDGRHVVAISPEGNILWRKDPFIEGGLQPYRMARPTIAFIGDARGGTVGIRFTSSQFGEIDIATGAFRFLGQD